MIQKHIPAENVYYEIILKDEGQEDLLNYAWHKRVIAVSPNSFYAYLQIISLGLKGLQVEQNAKVVIDALSRLEGEFDQFAEQYELIGTHLRNARSRYEEAHPRLDSIRKRLPGYFEIDSSEIPIIDKRNDLNMKEPYNHGLNVPYTDQDQERKGPGPV